MAVKCGFIESTVPQRRERLAVCEEMPDRADVAVIRAPPDQGDSIRVRGIRRMTLRQILEHQIRTARERFDRAWSPRCETRHAATMKIIESGRDCCESSGPASRRSQTISAKHAPIPNPFAIQLRCIVPSRPRWATVSGQRSARAALTLPSPHSRGERTELRAPWRDLRVLAKRGPSPHVSGERAR